MCVFSELNLQKNSIVQEFIANPFLIDGRKFNIGIFVIFTSGNPLRAYVQDNMVNFRFCKTPYDPEKLYDDSTMYITDGDEFGRMFMREVSMFMQWKKLIILFNTI